MKKVCHITSAHNRYDIRIFEKECQSLARNGYETFFLVNDRNNDEHKAGVNIVATGFNPRNRIDRILNSSRIMLKNAVLLNADIYHLHDPDLLLSAQKLRRSGKKVIFDSHEDVPSQIMGKQWIPKPFRRIVANIYTKFEKKTLPKLDALISVTPHLTERLVKLNRNIVEITNYPKVQESKTSNDTRERAICFAGGITPQWMHKTIIDAIERVGDTKYNLCGSDTNNYVDNELRALKGWNKVEYLGRIPHSKVQDVYSQSMVGVAIAAYNDNVKGNLGTLGNTKLFEIMLAGLPVICTDFILWKQIIDEHQCGICVQPDNVEEIASAIRYLLDNPDVANQMGENGRRAVLEKYNWGVEEKKLIKLYEDLLEDQ